MFSAFVSKNDRLASLPIITTSTEPDLPGLLKPLNPKNGPKSYRKPEAPLKSFFSERMPITYPNIWTVLICNYRPTQI